MNRPLLLIRQIEETPTRSRQEEIAPRRERRKEIIKKRNATKRARLTGLIKKASA